ncbi:hypothetical protein [Albibacterium indicum]|uniref:hypothetical protein n=1 Tax=Albibacterium indicum TaxID=2292082 RepID=UPI000E4F7FD5|nr:hypothetical protein [Pedobacter indicus]
MEENTLDEIVFPTYVINLKAQKDFFTHIKKEFNDKKEFELHIIDNYNQQFEPLAIWLSIKKSIKLAIDKEQDIIIICKEDHCFTESYDKEIFIKDILSAYKEGANILLGGIGNFNNAVPITNRRYWIDTFYDSQFIVIYKPLFSSILQEPFRDHYTAESLLSELTSNKILLYPFISVKYNYGFSDAKPNNRKKTNILQFKNAEERLAIYKKVYEKYIEKT